MATATSQRRHPALHPLFLAVAAGAMTFVAIAELVPLARDLGAPCWALLGGVSSVVVDLLLSLLIGG